MATDTRHQGPPPPPPPAPSPPSARLTRRVDEDDRWLGGVCGGLADHLGLDTSLVRVAFALFALFGGGGLALYLVLWIVLPERETGEVIASRFVDQGRRLGGDRGVAFWVGAALIGIAGIALLDEVFNGGVLWAVALIVVGVLLFQSDEDRRRDAAVGSVGPVGAPTPGAIGAPTPGAGSQPPTDDLGTAVPMDDVPGPPNVPLAPAAAPAPRPSRRRPRRPRSILGRLTLGLAVLWVGGAMFWNEATSGLDVTGAGIVGIAMAIVGLGLLVGARFGRARWLAVVGALLVPLLVGATVAERVAVPWGAGVGDRYVSAHTGTTEVSEKLFAGVLQVDLVHQYEDLARTEGEDGGIPTGATVERVELHVGAGELIVRVPAHWGLVVDARVGAGSIDVNGRDALSIEGIDRRVQQTFVGEDGAPVVRLDLAADLGEIRIDREEVR